MSDLSIPGVNSPYEKLVEALIKKERVPRDREAEKLERLKLQDDSWRQVNKFSLEVRNAARDLYSFNNPFVEKIAESTNERSFTATASRGAKDQNVKLNIVQVAEADKFLSSEISKDLQIKKGKYTFKVGEKNISVNWKGGKYKGFIDLINSKAKEILNITEIKITPDTKSLLFSSNITGANNRLEFADDALPFALEMGLIKKNDTSAIKTSVSSVETKPESSQKINFSETVKAKGQYVMELTVSMKEPTKLSDKIEDNGNKIYEQIGSISYRGIVIQNEPSKDGLDKMQSADKPSASASKTDMNILALESTRGVLIPLPPLSKNAETQTITIPLAEYGDVKALAINNNNTDKAVFIENIKIFDPKAAGDYVPVNPVSTAQDAIINFEGIQIKRDKNDIDDLIPGVTLHAHETSEKQEKLTIKPDVEAVKNAIIELVAKYNRVFAQINILTQNKPEIIEELTYLSEAEVEDAQKKLGLMYSDSTLMTLKSNLRQTINTPYKASEDSKIYMLAQLGVSTKSDSSGGIDMSRLRGYLEIDEKKLDEALNNNMEEVKLFFGFDSDGDILIDSGLAHAMYEYIDPYTQRGGIFGVKTDSLKLKMDSSQKRIENYDKKLAEKELALKKKYGIMDGTLKSLQKQSQTMKNFTDSLKKTKDE
ncbi:MULTISPECIES: flagellar filament capping protein FliD [unclassified Treponema]|uniref:flagellar filament capping protein FliD n=1 Tax=unclassified Treponema TaxID=2638727 RepID=UPI0020A4383D|nr:MULTISPECIES: flagellar filament capping protein FliD [unclassified Treponema]UTC68151.1 flagellar filament capping protein FliD [Treponema sp. OMZ 789]UTC70873.1 flagellar filament capping protein FliD [Treponema sp. OMZ 790]UTC73613.1 flagellar filament capping protein FliD [Treponema sp. OMZ 791]